MEESKLNFKDELEPQNLATDDENSKQHPGENIAKVRLSQLEDLRGQLKDEAFKEVE